MIVSVMLSFWTGNSWIQVMGITARARLHNLEELNRAGDTIICHIQNTELHILMLPLLLYCYVNMGYK